MPKGIPAVQMAKAWIDGLENNPYRRRAAANKALRAFWYLFRALLIFGLCFVLMYPLIYMLSMAFRPVSEAYDPAVIWIPKHFTLNNVREAIRLMEYPAALRNSVLVHVVSSLLQTMICATTGYGFARFEFKGKKALFAVVLFTILIPPQLIITPLSRNFAFFDFFGVGRIASVFGLDWTVNILDTPLTFFLPAVLGAGIKAGLFVFIFRQFFRGLPKELEDAAAIDGCGFFRTFVSIILPNALAVCLTVTILSVVWYWNDYFYSSLFIPNFPTVSLSLTNLSGAYGAEHIGYDPFDIVALMQAGALLTILPVLLMYILLQRHFVQGVERSGLVG